MKTTRAFSVMAIICALFLLSPTIINAAANITLVTSSSGPLAGNNVVYIEGDFATPDKITALDASYGAFVATSNTGHAYMWGYDSNGETANGYYGPNTSSGAPDAINPVHTAVGLDKITLKQVFTAQDGYHMYGITTDDELYGWGQKGDGQMADGGDAYVGSMYMYGAAVKITDRIGLTQGETIKDIATNYPQTFILTSNDRLIAFGTSEGCATGSDTSALYNDNYRDVLPTDITSYFPLNPGETITKLSAGSYNGRVITSEGRIFAWGDDHSNGSVTVEDPNSYVFPPNGFGWGSFICSPLEVTNKMMSTLEPGEQIVEINNYNWDTNLILTDRGNVYLQGGGVSSSIYPSGNTYVPLKVADNAKFAVYTYHNLYIITNDGRVMFQGENNNGESGRGDAGTPYGVLTDVTSNFSLAAGEAMERVICNESSRCAALTDAGRVFVWIGTCVDGNAGCASTNSMGNAINGDRDTPYPTEITQLFDGSGADVTSVYFGANAAVSYEVVNEHLIRAVVPAGAALGRVDVVVNGFGGAEITRKVLGYEYVGSGGNGENVVCNDGGAGAVPGVPNTGLSQFAEFMSSTPVRIGLLAVAVVSALLAGGIFMKIRLGRKS